MSQEILDYQNARRGWHGAIINLRDWGYHEDWDELNPGLTMPELGEILTDVPHNTDSISWYKYDINYTLEIKEGKK